MLLAENSTLNLGLNSKLGRMWYNTISHSDKLIFIANRIIKEIKALDPKYKLGVYCEELSIYRVKEDKNHKEDKILTIKSKQKEYYLVDNKGNNIGEATYNSFEEAFREAWIMRENIKLD
jgi:hypothetical protein